MIEVRLGRPRVRGAIEALGVGNPVEWIARRRSTSSVRPELAERNRETRHVRRLRQVRLLSPRIGCDVVVPSRDQRLIGVRATSCDQEMAVDDPRGRACVRGGARGEIGERVRDGVVLPRRRLHAVDRRRLEAAVQVDLAVRRVVIGGHLITRGGHVRARAPRVRRDVVDQGRVVENDRIRSSRPTTEEIDLVRRRVIDRGGDQRRLRHVSQRRPRVGRRVVAVDRGQRRADVLREVVAAEGVDVGAVGRRRRPEQGLRQRGNVNPRAGRWRRRWRGRWWWRGRSAAVVGREGIDEPVPDVVVRNVVDAAALRSRSRRRRSDSLSRSAGLPLRRCHAREPGWPAKEAPRFPPHADRPSTCRSSRAPNTSSRWWAATIGRSLPARRYPA